jgi:hypothetical protein
MDHTKSGAQAALHQNDNYPPTPPATSAPTAAASSPKR